MILNSKILKTITHGQVVGSFMVNSYSINTKSLKQDDMFIALVGEKYDAHNFLAQAISNGASALLINHDYYVKHQIDFPNLLIVKDTQKALLEIATFIRQSSNSAFVGITGSVGKTTLKDMLAFLLQFSGSVSATYANYNNHIGLPLSLLNMQKDVNFGVFEMGMSAPDEIKLLSQVLAPQIGVITDISQAHSEFFHSEDDIAKEKLDIITAMSSESILCINYDNKYYKKHYAIAKNKLKAVYSFSMYNQLADMYIQDISIQAETFPYFMLVKAQIFKQEVSFKLASIALHHGFLAMLALGIASLLKQDITKLAQHYSNFAISKGRGSISLEIINQHQVILIDDSYNASPKSMQGSLLALLALKNPNKILILGDMLELDNSEQHHSDLKDIILQIQPKAIILLGIKMLSLYNLLPSSMQKYHFTQYQEVIEKLISISKAQDIILVKGSKGSLSYQIVNAIQQK